MLKGINDYYNLELSNDALTLMKGFGGGLFKGDVCGLLLGAYAGLAYMHEANYFKSELVLKDIAILLYDRFRQHFLTVNCFDMKAEVGKCTQQAKAAAIIFEELISEIK